MAKSRDSFEKFSAVAGGYGEVDDVKIGFCFEACFGDGRGDARAIVDRCGGGAEKDILQMLVLFSLFLFWGCLRIMEHNCPPFLEYDARLTNGALFDKMKENF